MLFNTILGFGNQEIILISCWVVAFAFVVWSINDLMSNKDLMLGAKLIWLLIMLFFPFFGTREYLLLFNCMYGMSVKHRKGIQAFAQ